eukprot:scaffold24132_cov151-Skeletonema_dohrnii-CCMP3373.AAC.2
MHWMRHDALIGIALSNNLAASSARCTEGEANFFMLLPAFVASLPQAEHGLDVVLDGGIVFGRKRRVIKDWMKPSGVMRADVLSRVVAFDLLLH